MATQQQALFSMFFWSVDFLLCFVTAFYTESGTVCEDLKKITRKYVSSWCFIDFFIVASEWVCSSTTVLEDIFSSMRVGKAFVRYFRVLRLFRLMKISRTTDELFTHFNGELTLACVGISKLVILISMVCHYMGCLWFALGSWTENFEENTWTLKFHKEHMQFGYVYFTCLHWSLTQLTPASMEVVPVNKYERSYVCAVIVVSLVLFSSFVSNYPVDDSASR